MLTKRKRILLICFASLVVLTALTLAYLFLRSSNNKEKINITPPKVVGSVAKGNAMLSCGKDGVCVSENGEIKGKEVSKQMLNYLKHKCDDPRRCPPPSPEKITAGVSAIKKYENNDELLLSPITTNPSLGYNILCTKEKECWAIDSKTDKVISKIENQ